MNCRIIRPRCTVLSYIECSKMSPIYSSRITFEKPFYASSMRNALCTSPALIAHSKVRATRKEVDSGGLASECSTIQPATFWPLHLCASLSDLTFCTRLCNEYGYVRRWLRRGKEPAFGSTNIWTVRMSICVYLQQCRETKPARNVFRFFTFFLFKV